MDAQTSQFADSFKQALIDFSTTPNATKNTILHIHVDRLQMVLGWPDSPRKDRVMARMERHAAAALNQPVGTLIDWSNVDWHTVIVDVIRVLAAILPLLLL